MFKSMYFLLLSYPNSIPLKLSKNCLYLREISSFLTVIELRLQGEKH